MLRITRQTDYGIVLMTLFLEGGSDQVLSARDMAKQTKLPLPTVSKILKALTRADVLSSTRGVHAASAASSRMPAIRQDGCGKLDTGQPPDLPPDRSPHGDRDHRLQ